MFALSTQMSAGQGLVLGGPPRGTNSTLRIRQGRGLNYSGGGKARRKPGVVRDGESRGEGKLNKSLVGMNGLSNFTLSRKGGWRMGFRR